MRVWASTDFLDGASCREEGRLDLKRLGPGLSCIAAAAASPYMRSGPTRSRTIMPLARGAAPARRDPPETRRHLATKEEDGRAPHITVGAVIPPAATLGCYAIIAASALISTPSGSTPVPAKRQSAIRSRLAIATMAIRRVRPCSEPTRWRNPRAGALPGW